MRLKGELLGFVVAIGRLPNRGPVLRLSWTLGFSNSVPSCLGLSLI